MSTEGFKEILYLVTGAAGFLGGTVCRQLIDEGKKVRAFILPNDPARKFVPEEAEIVEGDLTDIESLKPFFALPEGAEAVVLHIASIVTSSPDFNQKVIDVNVGGTKNIIELCLGTPQVRKLVYCSSTGAIPEQPEGTAIKEIDYFDETKVPGCYAMSKALASQEVLDAIHHRGLNACIVHPSGIMGPGDYAIGEPTQNLIRIINGELPMGIDGDFNLCDVRDLAQGMIAAVSKGRCGECYILANEPVTFKEFCRMVTDESGGKKVSVFLPTFAANLMARMMEAKAKKSGEKALMTSFNVYSMARNNRFDSSKAKEELGYTTRSYEETIHDMVQWLLAEGIIKKEES
ncbi:MAG: NAD-dependent epimerase/dehydratase family protein [Blautia sp.]|nr:NAD-dependent epimerase/dehydratase family protein [Blautia sp.]